MDLKEITSLAYRLTTRTKLIKGLDKAKKIQHSLKIS